MPKVLILGATGNLGSQLIKVFSPDFSVMAWGSQEANFLDFQSLFSKIKSSAADIIINAAAYNAVDKCEEDPQEENLARKINGGAVSVIAQAAREMNVLFIHYSTDYVFSGQKKEGYQEDDQPAPISKYGETKLLGEEKIKEQAQQGLKFYLIRTSKLFGPLGKSASAKPSFFSLMLKLSQERDELNVIDAEISAFTYTPDLARATRKLVEDKAESGVYHLVNEGACSWYEGAKKLFELAGKEIKINPVLPATFPRPAARPAYSYLLNTKRPKLRAWQEALEDYLKNDL